MSEQGPSKPFTSTQFFAILAFTMALFFIIAFAAKSIDAYRLWVWRDHLKSDIAEMGRQYEELGKEMERRNTLGWIDEAVRKTGRVPPDVIVVVASTYTPGPALIATPQAIPSPAPSSGPRETALFDNPNWNAWQKLIWGEH